MNELKPCPFCGKAAYVMKCKDKEFPWKVKCSNINCGAHTVKWSEMIGAVKAWNQRAGDNT